MDKKELERTEEMLHRSLKELNDKGEYNGATLDLIGKAIDAIKDIHMIKGEENPSYGRGDWTAEGHYGRRMPDYRYYGKRDGDDDRIAPLVFQFRHIPEVHAVPARDQCQRHEDRGNDRKQ